MSDAPSAALSVVIPAHDEEAVLPALLTALGHDGIEVVVVSNGSSDATAEAARRAAPWATVVEIDEASKTAALRAGDEAARAFPRFYLDADIALNAADLHRLAAALAAPGAVAVAPSVAFDSSGSSALVRAYYRALPLLPAVSHSIAGTGCIGVTASGRARFDAWPPVLADDFFLDGLFRPDEKHRAPDVTARVTTPRALRDLVRRRERVIWGNRQVAALGLRAPAAGGGASGVVATALRHPRRLADLTVFAAVGVLVRVRVLVKDLRGQSVGWNRDDSRAPRA